MNLSSRIVAGTACGILGFAVVAPASATAAPPELATPGGVAAAVKARAKVSAVVSTHSSGRLLITVTSDAKRVLLTWRTAKNSNRSTIMKVKKGTAAGFLPGGSTSVYAKALATSTLKASPRVAATTAEVVAQHGVTNLTASASGGHAITLAWRNPADADFASVIIRRAKGASAPAKITEGDEVPVATPTATQATDTGLAPGTTYSYAVFAINNAGSPAAAVAVTAATPAVAPDCARTIDLGQSVAGRTISACRLAGASDSAPRTVLVVGSMHGNEQAGIAIATRLRAQDLTGRNANVWVIDTVNPDGTAAKTRGNSHKVDLNRNFPTKGWKQQGVGTTSWGGAAAASEPETRALMAAIAQVKPTEVVVFHQQLNLIDCSPFRSAALSQTLHDLTGYRYVGSAACLPTYVGTFTAWANQNFASTSAVTFELEAAPTAAKLDMLAGAMVQLAAR